MSTLVYERVSCRFGETTVLDGLDLEVHAGETMVLLGASGCGKTTSLRLANRLLDPSSGRILLGGRDIAASDPVTLRRGIGYVIQQGGLFPHLTVAENIATVPRLLGWDDLRIRSRVGELLELVGLPADFAERLPGQLSGGQGQRVGLARALAADPPVVLLDEPFGALDPITRHQLRREFRRLEGLVNKTMILVTHDVAEAIELGDRICLLDAGRAAQVGPPAELLLAPASEAVRAFFSGGRLLHEWSAVTVGDLADPPPGLDPSLTVLEAVAILDERDPARLAPLLAAYQAFRHGRAAPARVRA